jgi:phenylacetate-CoA ligase
VPLPWLLGGDFRRWYRFACEADRWDAERAREYQLAQLRRILTVAWERTEFYRESFKKVGFEPGDLTQPEDLQGLPTIDKATIREHWQRMLTRPITDPDVDLVTTGGTSGEPLRFYMSSSRHAPEFAHLCMVWKRMGYRPGDVMAVLRGRVIPQARGGIHHEYDPLLRHHYYSTFHMAPDDLRGYLRHMNSVQPRFLHAYPSSLFALARFAQSEGLSLPVSCHAALVESEPVFPHQRALIQGKLGLRVFSAYGLSEKVMLAAECEEAHDYHVVPTYGYQELVNERGAGVAPGHPGELTGTSFINEVMPFVRYRTGDYATQVAGRCQSCGRQQALIQDIQPRRSQEFLICRDGRTLISMAALNLHDDTLDHVQRFQFVQDQPGKASLVLVLATNGTAPNLERIQRHFAPKLAHGIDLEIRVVNDIPLTRLGKQPLILQRCEGANRLMGTSPEGVPEGCGCLGS